MVTENYCHSRGRHNCPQIVSNQDNWHRISVMRASNLSNFRFLSDLRRFKTFQIAPIIPSEGR